MFRNTAPVLTLYTVLLTLHILLVICWLGAGITTVVISRMAAGNDAWVGILEPFSSRWFPAASGLAGLTGVLLWIDGPWSFGEVWILLAVAGWVISSAIGATQLGPGVVRWAKGDLAGRAQYERLAPVDLAILLLIVADMVIKPGL
jgi:hypothetical protein